MKMSTLFSATAQLLFAAVLVFLPAFVMAQDNDNGRYDNIKGLEIFPPGYMGPISSNTISTITTPDGFDNYDIGVNNAEQHLSSNPNNPLQLIFGVNGSGTPWRHTDDGGLTWITSTPSGSNSGDPWSAYDSLGNVYVQWLSGSNNPVFRSTNNGTTWGPAVTSATGSDRNTMAVDQTSGPYAGHIYAGAWSPNCTFARSTNNGASFAVTFTTPNTTPGNMIAVGANVMGGQDIQGGCVYFVSVTGTNPQGTIFNFFRSTNGGASFDTMSSLNVAGYVGSLNTANRLHINNGRTRPYPMIAADNSFGPYRGRLYLVYASNQPVGNGNKPDIFIQYSTDQGATWTPRSQRVNDNPSPESTNEWFPAVWCDKNTGRLFVKWYDMRNDAVNNQRAWVYATYSDDGGQTFAPNQKLSNADMVYPSPACAANTNCYRGDYDAIVSNDGQAMAIWTDMRNGTLLNMTAYFPDFAMQVSPTSANLGSTDSTNVVVRVPAVKLYTNVAKFSASVSPSAPFTFSFPGGRDSLTSYPDSLTMKVKTNGVTPGIYTVTIKGAGPKGTPVHVRTVTVNVNYLSQGWTSQTSGVTSYLYSVKAVSNTVAWAAGNSGVVLRTTNSGTSWTNVGGGNLGTPALYNIDAVSANQALVTATPSTTTYIFRTTNAGSTWDTVYSQSGGFINAIKMYNATNGIAQGDPVDGRWTIVRTSDGGASWVRDTVNAPLQVGGEAGTQNGLTTVGTTHIWFNSGVGGRIYRSTDGGTTWTSGTTSFAATSNVAFNNTQYGVATGSTSNSVARSTDGGATWTNVTVAGSGFLLACAGSPPENFWYTRGTTIYRSTDLGATFSPSFTGTGTYVALSFYTSGSNSTGWAVTSTGGVAAFSGVVTGVEDQPARPQEVPQVASLMQNYPNPFNPTTTIRYSIAMASYVRLTVYNTLGQEVNTLIDQYQDLGNYSIVWDGRNGIGEPVSSGMYFSRIEATPRGGEPFTTIKKMMLLK